MTENKHNKLLIHKQNEAIEMLLQAKCLKDNGIKGDEYLRLKILGWQLAKEAQASYNDWKFLKRRK